MHRDIIHQLEQCLGETLVNTVKITDTNPCHGGDINQSYKINTRIGQRQASFFVKINTYNNAAVLESEKDNLQHIERLSKTDVQCFPRVIGAGVASSCSFLILEYLPLKSTLSDGDYRSLARALARLHNTHADQFGWHAPNHIGTQPQSNTQHKNWLKFWLNERLMPQWRKAQALTQSKELAQFEKDIFNKTELLLAKHKPKPSLCHGDLWAGNAGVTVDGEAVLYDPASYFGDSETDIAMTRLFGGFQRAFYEEYHAIHAPEPGIEERLRIYQLYHLLNHINLFGAGYLSSTVSMCKKILLTY